MRTKFTLILKVFFSILFSSVCLGLQAQTQTVPSFTFTIQNEVQTSDRTLEYDGYILSTDPSTVLEVCNTDFAVTFNTAMLNGGTITAALVSGSSQMSASQQPTVKVLSTGGVTTVYAYSYSISGKGTGTTISSTAPGTRFCRIKVTNTVPFASVTANLAHHLLGVPAETTLGYYDQIDGGEYDLDINSSTCYTSTVNPVLNTAGTVTTDAVSSTTNVASGSVTGLGSPYPTSYGFVYSSTNTIPTTSDSYVSKGAASSTGSYTSLLTGLIAGTTYYVRAYANNSVGTSYGSVISFVAANLAPTSVTYTTPNVYTKGIAITSLSPTVAGGTPTSYSISPTLPSGLSFNTSTGVISGIPTAVSAATTYTVTATNANGSANGTLSITVNDVAPTGITYTTPNVYTKGSAITSLSPTVTGGTPTGYSVSPALPSGLSFNTSTGVVSGTPTAVSASTMYTVTASNPNGSVNGTFSITVNDVAPTSIAYATPNVFTKGSAITSLSPTVTGGTPSGYFISPALPNGLAFSTATGVISGTPTVVSATATYTVTATNANGSVNGTLSITVNEVAPAGLNYTTPNVFVRGTTITPLTPTVSGGIVANYSISPALPAGLSINASTGIISGTPTVVAAVANYTVTATNTGGSVAKVVNITVNEAAPSGLSYTTPNVFVRGTGITSLVPTISGGVVTSYSVSPALPAGLSINTSTGIISGTPSVVSTMNSYTVTAANATSSTSFVLSVTVNEAAPSGLSYTTPNVFTKGMAITSLAPIVSGTVTSYSVSPALPTGLSINATNGIISGTPTAVVGQSNYTVIAANAGGNISFTISIAVNDIAPVGLSYQTPNVFTKGTAITPLSPTVSGGTVTSYSIVPALPSGLSFNSSTGVISGSPTAVASATNYTVTAVNSGGSVSFALSLTVNDIPPAGLSYITPNVFNKGTAIAALSPIVSGGSVTNYSVSPALPAGLSIDATTGVISGTPTAIYSAANYAVTASNTGGSTSFTVNITVLDAAPSGLKYTTPNVFTKEVSIVLLTPTVNGGTVTGYSVSPALPAGLSINTTTGVISGTPTAVSATGNYMVTASNSGGSCTFAVTITVNDDITMSPLAAPSAGCEASDLALTYTVLSGVPTQYQVKFNNQAILAGLSNIAYAALPSSTAGTIAFSIPKGMRAGVYTGYLQLKDNAGAESALYSFEFTVNLSSDYIITKFDDVIACDNSSYRFVSYQWYKNGVKIDGATKQFYNDLSGLVGTYMLQVTTTDGNTFLSCPKTFNVAKKSVKVFPNPVQANSTFSVQMIGFEEKELSTATLAVYDMQGICIYKSATVTSMNTLQLPTSQAYLGHITTSNGADYSFKVVVQQ